MEGSRQAEIGCMSTVANTEVSVARARLSLQDTYDGYDGYDGYDDYRVLGTPPYQKPSTVCMNDTNALLVRGQGR